MTTATTACEYLFNFHGVELRFSTSSQAFLGPVLTFLRHFHVEEVLGDRVLTMHFEEVASRADVPVQVSDTGKILFSGTRPSMGDSLRALWQCEILQDGDRIIADFHEQGLLLIDGARNLRMLCRLSRSA